MDFRCTLTEEERERLARIAKYHRRVYGVRTKSAIFRAWMIEEEKRIQLAIDKEKGGK